MSSDADEPSSWKGLLNTDKGSFALKETLKYKGFFAVIASKFLQNLLAMTADFVILSEVR